MASRVWNQLAANEQGFVQAWDLKNVRPEPLLIEKQMYKISCKSSAMLVKPELKPIMTNAEVNNHPAIAKQPHVAC